MGNIRHFKAPEIEVIVGGVRIQPFDEFLLCENVDVDADGEPVVSVDFKAAIERGMDRARQEDADRRDTARWAVPLDEGMSEALREVHASDMPGAEKLAAIQALQRVTTENHCAECGGDGWVVGVENADPGGGDPGNQCQIDCPSCVQFRDVWDPVLGVFVQKAL